VQNKDIPLRRTKTCVSIGTFHASLFWPPAHLQPKAHLAQRKRTLRRPQQPRLLPQRSKSHRLRPWPSSNPSQVKGGLRITLSTTGYSAVEETSDSARQAPPPSKFGMVLKPAPNAIYVQHTQTTQLVVKPDRLALHVHINNDLPGFSRIGDCCAIHVAGKVTNVDPSGYGDLVNLLIPPRSEQEVTIVGPKIEGIPSPCTVGIFLYDVVTKMDEAGNVTEKQNFEWYFSYRRRTRKNRFLDRSQPQAGSSRAEVSLGILTNEQKSNDLTRRRRC